MANTFEKKLDEIFNDDYFDVNIAKQKVKDLVLNDVIGEEEKHPAGTARFAMVEKMSRNELRAEQRAIITNEGEGDE